MTVVGFQRAATAVRGRWMSLDPSGLDGPNLYMYVRNTPVNYVDTTGEYSQNIGGLVYMSFDDGKIIIEINGWEDDEEWCDNDGLSCKARCKRNFARCMRNAKRIASACTLAGLAYCEKNVIRGLGLHGEPVFLYVWGKTFLLRVGLRRSHTKQNAYRNMPGAYQCVANKTGLVCGLRWNCPQ